MSDLVVTPRSEQAMIKVGRAWETLIAEVDEFKLVASTAIADDESFVHAKNRLKELNAAKASAIEVTKAAREDARAFASEVIQAEKKLEVLWDEVKIALQERIEAYKAAAALKEAATPRGQLKAATALKKEWEAKLSKAYGSMPTAIFWNDFITQELVIPNGLLNSPEATYGMYLDGLKTNLADLISRVENLRDEKANAENAQAWQQAKVAAEQQALQTQLGLQEKVIASQELALASAATALPTTTTVVVEKPTPLPVFEGSDSEKLISFLTYVEQHIHKCAPAVVGDELDLLAQYLEAVSDVTAQVKGALE